MKDDNIKPLSNDWNKKESYQEGTDRSVKRVKDILESKPLSSGEKEEQCQTCGKNDNDFCSDSFHLPMSALQIAVYAVNCPNTNEHIDEVAKAIERFANKKSTTRPVQEKPDFVKIANECPNVLTHDPYLAYIAGMEYIWKNYVELETSRAEGWRKQYYDWKDLLLTTEEENRKLKQEIQHLKQPLQPVKSLQDCKDEVAKKYDLDSYLDANVYNRANELADEVAELYASQFKTPPVQEDQNLLSVISDLGAWINQEIDITEGQGKLFKESKNRDMAARCDSSIRTYQKVIRRIEELKSKYTIIPKQ